MSEPGLLAIEVPEGKYASHRIVVDETVKSLLITHRGWGDIRVLAKGDFEVPFVKVLNTSTGSIKLELSATKAVLETNQGLVEIRRVNKQLECLADNQDALNRIVVNFRPALGE